MKCVIQSRILRGENWDKYLLCSIQEKIFGSENLDKYLVCTIYAMTFRGEKYGNVLSSKVMFRGALKFASSCFAKWEF
jgi:hypothetical protein